MIWGAFFGTALSVRVGLKGSGDTLTNKSTQTMASKDFLSLPLLPSDRAIVVPACDDIAFVILQGVLKLNAHLPSSARSQSWPDLEHLLWDSNPPNPGPFSFSVQAMVQGAALQEHQAPRPCTAFLP